MCKSVRVCILKGRARVRGVCVCGGSVVCACVYCVCVCARAYVCFMVMRVCVCVRVRAIAWDRLRNWLRHLLHSFLYKVKFISLACVYIVLPLAFSLF